MTTTHLTPDDSFSYGTAGSFDVTGGSGSNTVTIDPGTLMFTTGIDDDAGVPLYLAGVGQWGVSVGGSLWSSGASGLVIGAHASGSKASTITVTAEGSIFGAYAGINVGGFSSDTIFRDTPITIKIDGEVGAQGADDGFIHAGIYFNTTAAHTVTNTGKVYGYWGILSEGSAADTITNSGEMEWVSAGGGTNKMVNTYHLRGYEGLDGADSVENNGSNAYIGDSVFLGDGTNTLKNSGFINYYAYDQPGVFGGSGSDTVTNSGKITGGVDLGEGKNSLSSTDGIIGAIEGISYWGGSGDDTVSNTSPSVFQGAVHVGSGSNKLTNSGSIGVDDDGYSYAGGSNADSVTNSGILAGNVDLGDGANSLTNSKEIDGDIYAGTGVDTFTNSAGGVVGTVNLGSGNNKVSNSGLIATLILGNGADSVTNESSGRITSLTLGGAGIANTVDTLTNKGTIGVNGTTSILGDAAGDTITNSGTILGLVALGNGTNKLTNTGAIGENEHTAILGGTGTDSVTSSKAILGGIDLGEGTNTLINSGAVGEDTHHLSYSGGAGTDTVTNSGTLIGDVWLGDGADTFTDFSGKTQGTVHGIIDLGGGADKFVGGNNVEYVIDNDGADNYALGGGDDQFIAFSTNNTGTDTVDGGAGLDIYVAADATADVHINLSTVAQVDNFHVGPVVNLAASTATGNEIGTDIVKAFENAAGGSGNDIIIGTDGTTAANYIFGNDGDDDLAGLGGADTLIGGAGSDGLLGGAGRDVLTGGDGITLDGETDFFVYTSVSDSGVTASTRDTITDFEMGIDEIDLHLIDANSRVDHPGDDAFTFIGTNVLFNHIAGELRAYWTVSGQIVEGDTNGDGRADFSIQVSDVHGGDAFQSSDFIL